MKGRPAVTGSVNSPQAGAWQRLLTAAAVVSAVGFGLVLGVRPLMSADLGYHLSYGEAFWDEGRIVDHDEAVYGLGPYAARGERPEVGPGCWYDDRGRYRFPNANWLSQVVMAGVHRWLGGAWGLCVLRLAMVGGVFVLSLRTMRNLKLPWAPACLGLILIGLVSYPRFLLRPELFGYLLLAAQLCILTRRGAESSPARWRLGWPAVAALIFLQLLQANVHSYFLLGLALTGAVLVDRAVYLWWYRQQARPDPQAVRALRRALTRLGVVLVGQAAACFANPWTWRLAALPVQTLLFTRKHDIASSRMDAHPWAMIGEFFWAFAKRAMLERKATYAFYVLLGLVGLGVPAALLKRRWASALIVAGMTAVAVSMRRNIAVASMVIVPLAMACVYSLAAALARGRRARPLGVLAGAAAALASAGLIFWVATQRFYTSERSPIRFGLGFDRLRLALDAADWISRNNPAGRLWCDYNSSSNLHYFTQPHRRVPVVTNTWAYPPQVMADALAAAKSPPRWFQQGRELPLWPALQKMLDEYDPQILVARANVPEGLVSTLAQAKRSPWRVVFVDSVTVVFLRDDGPNRQLAERWALTAETFDVDEHIRRIEQLDPAPADRLFGAGATLIELGWHSAAMTVLHRCLQRNARDERAWNSLGICYATRARQRFVAGDVGCIEDYQAAERYIAKSLSIRPGYRLAEYNMRLLAQRIEEYRAHVRSQRQAPPSGSAGEGTGEH